MANQDKDQKDQQQGMDQDRSDRESGEPLQLDDEKKEQKQGGEQRQGGEHHEGGQGDQSRRPQQGGGERPSR